FESTQRLMTEKTPPVLTSTFVTCLAPEADELAMGWCAFGSADRAIFFPVFLDGALPAFLSEDNQHNLRAALQTARNRNELDQWQARLDQQASAFRLQARLLRRQGNLGQLQREATSFMAQLLRGPEEDQDRDRRRSRAEELAYIAE